jgi:hypothetical protein
MRDSVETEEYNAAVRQYTVVNAEYTKSLSGREAAAVRAAALLDGTYEIDEPSGKPWLARYPDQALTSWTDLDNRLTDDISRGQALLAGYDADSAVRNGAEGVLKLRNALSTQLNALMAMQTKARSSITQAKQMIADAAALRAKAEQEYNTATASLTANKFDDSRTALASADMNYTDAFKLQEEQSARYAWNDRYSSLLKTIQQQQRTYVVKQVNDLLQDAKEQYFYGNFAASITDLNTAASQWKIIEKTDNADVVSWLSIVRGAMSLRNQRSIPVTAPLYPEMSQLLSNANEFYIAGSNLLGQGKRQEGLAQFDKARKATTEVRLMFPINQAASLLELRMAQVTDPSAFSTDFVRRYREAVAGAKKGSRQSLADLQDLAAINPKYPGIQQAVIQAEIDTGVRPPPQDKTAMNQAQALAVSAQRLYQGGVRSQFGLALEQANRALRLNPGNALALKIKSSVQNELGIGGGLADSETELQYQRAVQLLQQGSPIIALSIVERLLSQKANANSARLLELRRRIQAMM